MSVRKIKLSGRSTFMSQIFKVLPEGSAQLREFHGRCEEQALYFLKAESVSCWWVRGSRDLENGYCSNRDENERAQLRVSWHCLGSGKHCDS